MAWIDSNVSWTQASTIASSLALAHWAESVRTVLVNIVSNLIEIEVEAKLGGGR